MEIASLVASGMAADHWIFTTHLLGKQMSALPKYDDPDAAFAWLKQKHIFNIRKAAQDLEDINKYWPLTTRERHLLGPVVAQISVLSEIKSD